ncbi:MlaC/ttg2D family ABC transporter substrate-binding protein [Henriciella aquimarina]|uniref:MlaC/ttg2D family ABC transporter substrate-binding protein n=1 Tax=Henriciella aquimarina TaxID=545261 RepID=UPI001F35DA81|nr:ABC transporter substrate-binding protein [Henriciella aquimarina]
MMKVRSVILSAAALLAATAPAMADAKTEQFVKQNANEVLNSLNNPSLSADERTALFSDYMEEFADLNAVSKFVIGKYARRFTDEEMKRYQHAFRTYALAVYENELDAYRGEEVVVQGSTDRTPRDSIVDTTIERSDGKAMSVRWRVLDRGGEYQVVDVALDIDGNLIWLAIEQQAQFLALLDRTNGSAQALIDKINGMTAKLESERR